MITSECPAMGIFASAAMRHLDLLAAAERVTDQLAQAIKSWESGTVNSLLAVRSQICGHIGDSTRQMNATHALAQRSLEGDGLHEMAAIIERVQAGQNRVAKKHADCEALLSAELNQVGKEIRSLKQNGVLRRAYSAPAGARNARFLDSTL
jgi:hypothetical protein